MTAYSRHLGRLWAEIALYLEITDLLSEDDSFWREYVAFKNLCEKKGYTQQEARPGLAGSGEASLGAAG